MPYERFNKPDNTTSIDELEDNYTQQPQPMVEKFIRGQHIMPAESGMYNNRPELIDVVQPVNTYEPVMPQRTSLTCPDVYMHIMNCPVCKKIYGQNSNPNFVYICIIIILLIFCVLLFKKAFP
jgi:hypothetical protein